MKTWLPDAVPHDDMGRIEYPKDFPRPTEALAMLAGTVATFAQVAGIRDYPKDQYGWLLVKPSPDSRLIYVSNSTGDDRNDGLLESTPKKSIAAGRALLRDGFPDWLLLREGDAWLDEPIQLDGLRGRSETEPMVVSSYGKGKRPRILNLTRPGINWSFTGAQGTLAHIAILGIELEASTDPKFWVDGGSRFPAINVITNGPLPGLHIEDCVTHGFNGGPLIQPYSAAARLSPLGSRVRLVRNYFLDPTYIGPVNGPACAYLREIDGYLFEGNWVGSRAAHIALGYTPPSEGLYACESAPGAESCIRNGVVIGNGFLHCNSAANMRSGPTICQENYTIGCSMHLNFGIGYWVHRGWVFCSGNLGEGSKYAVNIHGSGNVPVQWFIHAMVEPSATVQIATDFGRYADDGRGDTCRAIAVEGAETVIIEFNATDGWESGKQPGWTQELVRVNGAKRIFYGGNTNVIYGNTEPGLLTDNNCPVTITAPNPVVRISQGLAEKPASPNRESYVDWALRVNRRGSRFLVDPKNYANEQCPVASPKVGQTPAA